MSIRDYFSERLAPDDPDPRGESPDEDTSTGSLFSYLTDATRRMTRSSPDTLDTDVVSPPDRVNRYWREYYDEFAITRRALRTFDSAVIEPGYKVEAKRDGETDEEMTEALELWASNCVIHEGLIDQDLSVLLRQLPSQRRGKGGALIEIAGSEGDEDELRALLLHDPTTFRIYKRENQNLIIQPDDNVPTDHPLTPDGRPAAYAQAEDFGGDNTDPTHFAADEMLKLAYDADYGVWGTSIFAAIGDRIDALNRKWTDRDTAIHRTGHPHRTFSSESWTPEEAQEYAKKHKEGELSALPEGVEGDTWAGRVDFLGGPLEVEHHEGSVADILDAVKDDIEAIFAAMPVSKYRIAYAEDINQFVVEPQAEDDAQRIDDERRYLERHFEPVFERKADELANGSYSGEVSFRIEPDKEDNPLQREAFPAENLTALTNAVKALYSASADPAVINAVLADAGYDPTTIEEDYGFSPEDLATLAVDEQGEAGQAQQDAFEEAQIPEGGDPADAGTDGDSESDEDDEDE